MIRILWVDDDPLETVAPATVLDRIERGEIEVVSVESYLDALDAITSPDLHQDYDAIILDAALPASTAADPQQYHQDTFPLLSATLAEWYGCPNVYQAPDQFRHEAGYLLFRDLVLKHRFPAERIVFLSAHLDRLEDLLKNLKAAKIALTVYSKNVMQTQAAIGAEDEFLAQMARWETDEYVQLRRCVIDLTCDISAQLESSATVPFLEFLSPKPNDWADYREQLRLYLDSLRRSLPPLPAADGGMASVLTAFLRALSILWEDRANSRHLNKKALLQPDFETMKAIADSLKTLRNRLAHNQIDGEFTVAAAHMLFLAAMGVMFGGETVASRLPRFATMLDLPTIMEKLRDAFVCVMQECADTGVDVDAVPLRKHYDHQVTRERITTYRLLDYGACLDYLATKRYYRCGADQLSQLLWQNLFPRYVARGPATDPGKIDGPFGRVNDAVRLAKLAEHPQWGWVGALLQWEGGRCFGEAGARAPQSSA